MKAITVHQPYAWLLATGHKVYETRSWQTEYRGEIAIHAGKSDEVLNDLAMTIFAHREMGKEFSQIWQPFEFHFLDVAREYPGMKFRHFNRGAIIAIGTLVNCIAVSSEFEGGLSDKEKAFGFYGPGRYAWELEDVVMLSEPVYVRGALGVWDWNQEVLA